ncbi:DNA cytosine methyltransferase [Psychromonas sp. SP041]|uniref:DNA cytosine methyltransferase n=1 Tax=Psychromonas sp. SP041 TaxID=1365007 RepID=UPI0010C79F48|nr:DNA cytosine methyltransferase [Psychromonas sp. SP041]
MFIKRIHRYAVKKLKSGAARIYIQNSDTLRSAGLPENSLIDIEYSKNSITIKLDENGKNKIMDTGRGALLELKNKKTAESVGEFDFVTVTFRKGKVVISLHYADVQKLSRERNILQAVMNGEAIRTSSFFSGLGMLSYHLKEGLKRAGIDSQITFANDICPIAMECNLSGNPMWDTASHDAFVSVDALENLDLSELKPADMVEVGYSCVGQSTLCKKENRDLDHPIAGTLFVKLLAALEKINPAIVVFENTPAFVKSKTLNIIKREMKGYRFEECVFNGHEFGELEARRRVCVVAISDGLGEVNLSSVSPGDEVQHNILGDFLDPVPLDSELWREMAHVKKKVLDPNLNYKNMLYNGTEKLIATITATYSSPKVGSPMIAHPTVDGLQRQIKSIEHARIRLLPDRMFVAVKKIINGDTPMVSAKGSSSAANRLLGNGVSKKLWQAIGCHLGSFLKKEILCTSEQIV